MVSLGQIPRTKKASRGVSFEPLVSGNKNPARTNNLLFKLKTLPLCDLEKQIQITMRSYKLNRVCECKAKAKI